MEKKHSWVGLASFLISISAAPLFFLTLFVAVIMDGFRPTAVTHDPIIEKVLVPLILFLLLANFVALGLGIAGIFRKNRNKIPAILGTVFSSVPLIFTTIRAISHNFK